MYFSQGNFRAPVVCSNHSHVSFTLDKMMKANETGYIQQDTDQCFKTKTLSYSEIPLVR